VSNQFQPLADGEVVSIESTYRVSELAAKIRTQVAHVLSEWSTEEGIDGEALRFGYNAWQKGKVRLHLSIEFAPDDDATAAAVPPVVAQVNNPPGPPPDTTNTADRANFQAQHHTPAAAGAQSPPIDSTLEDDNFAFGTMSDVTGEIEMNLSDNEDDQNGYVDFDLSAAMLEINLDELVSHADGASLIDEVWNEMSQPNWPGVSRT
jgi:hypothetical protein